MAFHLYIFFMSFFIILLICHFSFLYIKKAKQIKKKKERPPIPQNEYEDLFRNHENFK